MTHPRLQVLRVDLLTVPGCPHRGPTLARLRALLDSAQIRYQLTERLITSEAEATAERFLGSPTIRIGGVDIDPAAAHRRDYGITCRLYPTADGARATPPRGWIEAAVRHAQPHHPRP